jgi:hypothetical protein
MISSNECGSWSHSVQMTLRAIGNLTRCDENIMRAVGYGVIRGMVDGMSKHGDDPVVLQVRWIDSYCG